MNLAEAIHDYDDTQLLGYLEEEIANRGNYGGLLCILLQQALSEGRSITVIFKLMDMGGSELVKKRNEIGETALHFACMAKYSPSLHVISRLIELGGGREMVMLSNECDQTALHYACMNSKNVSLDIISKLIEIGGRELVMKKEINGFTSLYCACDHENVSIDVISKLIDVGGKELVMQKDFDRAGSALNRACQQENVSVDIISKLLDIGGRELLMDQNNFLDLLLCTIIVERKMFQLILSKN